jgi:dihydroxyacetone kinase DhaKLM complex PTS-EIIA-like component DhaM
MSLLTDLEDGIDTVVELDSAPMVEGTGTAAAAAKEDDD